MRRPPAEVALPGELAFATFGDAVHCRTLVSSPREDPEDMKRLPVEDPQPSTRWRHATRQLRLGKQQLVSLRLVNHRWDKSPPHRVESPD